MNPGERLLAPFFMSSLASPRLPARLSDGINAEPNMDIAAGNC